MQVIARAIKSCQERFRIPVVQHLHKYTDNALTIKSQKGMENTTVAEVLMTKEDENVGSWLWCKSDDTVYDAVKQMARNNIGSLVVLKPGDEHMIAGIITERDYLQKVIVKDRSSKYTKVGEIMTEQNKLVTVTSDTNIYQAMRLMSDEKGIYVFCKDNALRATNYNFCSIDMGPVHVKHITTCYVSHATNSVYTTKY